MQKFTTERLLAYHEETCSKAREIMSRKNHDYAGSSGTTPFANFQACEDLDLASSETGILIRVLDKIQRIKTYIKAGKLAVKNESAEDACHDCINYFILLGAMIAEKSYAKVRKVRRRKKAKGVRRKSSKVSKLQKRRT